MKNITFETYYINPFHEDNGDEYINCVNYINCRDDKEFQIYNELYYRYSGYVPGTINFCIDEKIFSKPIETVNLHMTWRSYIYLLKREENFKKFYIAYDCPSVETYFEKHPTEKMLRFVYNDQKTDYFSIEAIKQAIVKGFMEFMSHTNRNVESLKYMDQEDDDEITEEILEANEIYEKMLSDSKKGKPLY